jgi:hypothetical protein
LAITHGVFFLIVFRIKLGLCFLFQFFHDVQFLDEDLGLFLNLMNSDSMRTRVETQEAEVMGKHLRVNL